MICLGFRIEKLGFFVFMIEDAPALLCGNRGL